MFDPRRYQVSGARPVLEHQPGDIFEADLDPVQESRLIESGALTILPGEPDYDGPRLDDPPEVIAAASNPEAEPDAADDNAGRE